MKRLTHSLTIITALLLAYLFVLTGFARAGVYQNQAVKVASISTGMPPSTWRLNVTNDMPSDDVGYWSSEDPQVANVRPLRQMEGNYTLWCMVIVHEAWHVKNQNADHSSDPNNISFYMLPSPTNYIYPPCEEVPDVPDTKAAPATSQRSGRRPDYWHSRHHR